ncbi:MAG: ATP-binding cassette domain-containing protein [Succinivibrionaceae bacterium]
MNRLSFSQQQNLLNVIQSKPYSVNKGKVNIFFNVYEEDTLFVKTFLCQLKDGDTILIPENNWFDFSDVLKNTNITKSVYGILDVVSETDVELEEITDIFLDSCEDKFLRSIYLSLSSYFNIVNSLASNVDEFIDFCKRKGNIYSFIVKMLYAEEVNTNELKNWNAIQINKDFHYKLKNIGKIVGLKINENIILDNIQIENKVSNNQDVSLLQSVKKICSIYHLNGKHHYDILTNHRLSISKRLEIFAKENNLRIRKISLHDDFYKESSRTLLAFIYPNIENKTKLSKNELDDVHAVILTLKPNKKFFEDVQTGDTIYLTSENKDIFHRAAYIFYETFDDDIYTYKGLFKFFFRYLSKFFWLLAFLSIFTTFFSIVLPLVTKYVIGRLIPMGLTTDIIELTIFVMLLAICNIGFSIVPKLMIEFFNSLYYERFQVAIFDKVLRMKIEDLQKFEYGDLVNRILGTNTIQNGIFPLIFKLVVGLSVGLMSFIVMLFLHSTLAFIALLTYFFYLIIYFVLMFQLYPIIRNKSKLNSELSGIMTQFINGIEKIKSSNASSRVISRFFEPFAISMQLEYDVSFYRYVLDIINKIYPLLVVFCFVAFVGVSETNSIMVSSFIAFLVSYWYFQKGLVKATSSFKDLFYIKADFESILPILKTTSENHQKLPVISRLEGAINIVNVSFKYDDNTPFVLQNINMEVRPGDFVAIVGGSGSGKTTLIKLLLGFVKTSIGGIYYDGKEISNIDISSVRSLLGVILQNSKIVAGSILDNVILGTSYGILEAKQALKQVGLWDEIEKLPMNIHTIVSSDNISGGQQQRILIARALIGNPSVIIMDEATSALDNISQTLLQENLEKLNVTRIVVAHRLSTVVNADRIYVLDKGKCVENGNYRELMEKGGLFKKLVMRQLIEDKDK